LAPPRAHESGAGEGLSHEIDRQFRTLPLTLPQVLGLMQNAQGLPGAQSTAQTSTQPGATAPIQSSGTSSGPRASGALPGSYPSTVG
jgi:hypothetical protein